MSETPVVRPSARYEPGNSITRRGIECKNCGSFGHEHDKERVYPDKGPSGSYHYEYHCPEVSE